MSEGMSYCCAPSPRVKFLIKSLNPGTRSSMESTLRVEGRAGRVQRLRDTVLRSRTFLDCLPRTAACTTVAASAVAASASAASVFATFCVDTAASAGAAFVSVLIMMPRGSDGAAVRLGATDLADEASVRLAGGSGGLAVTAAVPLRGGVLGGMAAAAEMPLRGGGSGGARGGMAAAVEVCLRDGSSGCAAAMVVLLRGCWGDASAMVRMRGGRLFINTGPEGP
jgi:hypothetical protein